MTHDDIRAYIAHHAGNRSIRQIAQYCGISTQDVRDIYDTVVGLPLDIFPQPASDHMMLELSACPARSKPARKGKRADVRRLYDQGLTIDEIAETLELTSRTIFKYIDMTGGRRKKATKVESVFAEIGSEWKSKAEININLGFEDKSVKYALIALTRDGRIESKRQGRICVYRLAEVV